MIVLTALLSVRSILLANKYSIETGLDWAGLGWTGLVKLLDHHGPYNPLARPLASDVFSSQ